MSGRLSSWKDKDERYQPSTSRSRSSHEHHGTSHSTYQAKKKKKTKPAKEVIDCRRSTAAQFFVEEEMVHDTASADRVVRILKRGFFIQAKQPKLLDNFLDEVISFQHDKNSEVRTFVVNFIEEACMHDMKILPKVISNLKMLLDDKSIKVQKKVIQTTIKLYTHAIRWLSKASVVDEVMEATWGLMTHLKHSIFALIESDNEGIRAFVVKFMERVVVTQTYHDGYSQKRFIFGSDTSNIKHF
ncbi:symplekin [Caerostris extrusa]|uniref:Symplekin n=1 Tax=Caerostris extrusa TaxID=172846 RepID=A0AAV4XIZ6_CAEEX|nr:symplekin [Caerostris extrusa]